MGFMDKVKATAEKVGEKAQEGLHQGQQKLSEVQERKRVDGLLRDLGAATFFERTGRGSPAVTSEVERTVAALREAEAAGAGIELAAGAGAGAGDGDGQPGAGDGGGEATPPGSYTLDDV
jgi:hypothetical protein